MPGVTKEQMESTALVDRSRSLLMKRHLTQRVLQGKSLISQHRWKRCALCTLVVVCLVLLVLGAGCTKGQIPPAPTAVGSNDPRGDDAPLVTQTVLRTRLMDIPSPLQHPDDLQAGHVIEITLFEDAQYRARIRTLSRDAMGTLTFTADVEEYPGGSVIAAETGGTFLITIGIPSERKTFIIRFDLKAERYRVDEVLIQELPH
ncbi:MAG: hypothetical protein RRA35_13185 [Desulfomonilia bacterium]|nr:hypothetical protein [Desulfomonilia bacterium]